MPKFSVHRTAVIDAPIEDVFDRLADYSTWTCWSPWLCAEPDTKVTVSQNPSAVGSRYQWEGEITGSGVLEHKQLDRPREIIDEITFLSGFKSTSEIKFQLQSVDQGTQVTWYMNGSVPWFLFFMTGMMDGFIGRDYERGLKMFKEWVETGEVLSQTEVQGVQPVGPLRMAGIRQTCSLDEIGPSMQAVYPKVCQAFEKQSLPIGEGIAAYHQFDMKRKVCEYTAGFTIDPTTSVQPDLEIWELPAVSAIKVIHRGSYSHLGNGWSAAFMYQRYRKLKPSKLSCFERYINSPSEVPEKELETHIYVPTR